MTSPTILRCRGSVFTELLPSKDMVAHRQNDTLSFDKIWTAQKVTSQTILLCVFVNAGRCLPSRCLATKGGIHFTKTLPEVGVLLAADSQSTSKSGYRASLWDP
jgi:hypothetical protein